MKRKRETNMKKYIKMLLALALMITALPPLNIKANNRNEMTMQEWIDYNASIGIIIEEITTEELIENLSLQENLTVNEVMEKYDLNPNVRNISDFYTVKFSHNEPFSIGAGDGAVGTVVSHNITIKLYNSGSFREILHVYGSTLTSSNAEFNLSNIVPHTPDWDWDYVSCYTTGELRVLKSLCLGFTLYNVVSISVNGIPYWKRDIAYGDTLELYP